MPTGISYCDEVLNVCVGCTPIKSGCKNCWAEALHTMRHNAWVTKLGEWTSCPRQYQKPFNEVQLLSERLNQPLHWRKPRRIFVNSVSDTFHKDVPFAYIDKLFGMMVRCPQHTFMLFTKRWERCLEYFQARVPNPPLSNVHLFFSASNQEEVDKAVPILLTIPAAKRGLSLEPLLGPIDFNIVPRPETFHRQPLGWKRWFAKHIHSIIVGGESGKNARPMHPQWARDIRDQCVGVGVPFYFKQWGEWLPLVDDVENYGSTWGASAYNRALKRMAQAHGASILLDDRQEGWDDIMLKIGCAVSSGLMHGRVGKKKAGNLLDGKVWEEYPK